MIYVSANTLTNGAMTTMMACLMFKYKMKLIFEINDFAGDRSVAVRKTPLLHLAEVRTFLRCLWTLFEKHLWGENIFEISLNIILNFSRHLMWEHIRHVFEHYLKKTSLRWDHFQISVNIIWTSSISEISLKHLWDHCWYFWKFFETSLKHIGNARFWFSIKWKRRKNGRNFAGIYI